MVTVVLAVVILFGFVGVLHTLGYNLEDAKIAYNKALLNLPTSANSDIADVSVFALACAIDATAFEEANPGLYGMDTLDNCNGANLPMGVTTNPAVPDANTKSIAFGIEAGHTTTVTCNPADGPTGECAVENFYLPQEISGDWKNWIEGAGDPHFMVYNSALPDDVENGIQLVVMGLFNSLLFLNATQILVQCS